MTRPIVLTGMLFALTFGAANARADKLLPVEREAAAFKQQAAAQKAEAAKVRGLSINPMSKLNFGADRSLRTPEVKDAMRTLVRYIAAKRAQGAESDLSVLVYQNRFAVTANGKIRDYTTGHGTRVTGQSMNGVQAAGVATSIKQVAAKIKRGEAVPTDNVYSVSAEDAGYLAY